MAAKLLTLTTRDQYTMAYAIDKAIEQEVRTLGEYGIEGANAFTLEMLNRLKSLKERVAPVSSVSV